MNLIRFRNNNLCIENISALRLTKKYQTPFYCYSLAQLRNNFLRFNNIFKNIKPIICFSAKSNSNLTLLRELRKIGSGADVVSIGELLKAVKVGINSKKIVFSGVGKTEEEISKAVKKRILLINVESESEAILINKVSKKLSKKTSIGIRLNPNISGNTHKKISTGNKSEKFGFFSESFVCNVNNQVQILSKEQLLKELNQNVVSCKDVTFRILGLSLAAINTILSVVLSIIFLKLIFNYGSSSTSQYK